MLEVARLARLANRAKVALLSRMMKMIYPHLSTVTLSNLLKRNKAKNNLPDHPLLQPIALKTRLNIAKLKK